MRRRTPQRAWQRSDKRNAKTDPARILREDKLRRLVDLETCRRVWEQGQDPLALCEAVRQSKLPEWLESALLAMLTDSAGHFPSVGQKLWRSRSRDAEDWARVSAMASARSLRPDEITWDFAARLGDARARDVFGDVAAVSPAGMKRAYQRVCAGLEDPARYYKAKDGMQDRIVQALDYLIALMQAKLDTRK